MEERKVDRREFFKKTVAASLALGLGSAASNLFALPEEKPVRLGFVGVGNRGSSLLRHVTTFPGVEIPALCDINEENLARAQKIVQERLGK